MNKFLIFDIAALADKHTGAKETFSLKGPAKFEDLKLSSDIKAKVEIMRIEDGFNVKLENLEFTAEQPCDRCLESSKQKVNIVFTERVFWIDTPKKVEDPDDLFLIDKKHLKLDIAEMLRQEIILHLPINPVCSKSCKSICPICGKDKNLEVCICDPDQENQNKPLSLLKALLK